MIAYIFISTIAVMQGFVSPDGRSGGAKEAIIQQARLSTSSVAMDWETRYEVAEKPKRGTK